MRSPLRRLLAVLVSLPCAVLAHEGTEHLSGDLEHLVLDPAARGGLLVGNGQTLPRRTFRNQALFQYSNGHVRGPGAPYLEHRFALQVSGALGLTDWLELSVDLPVILRQTQASGALPIHGAGMGTPYVTARLGMLDSNAPVSLSASLGLGLPIGSPESLGNGGFTVVPKIGVGRVYERFQVGAELGGLFREKRSLALATLDPKDTLGSQLALAAMVASRNEGPRAELNARFFVPLSEAPVGLELLVGLRWPFGGFELVGLFGPGLGGAPDTPLFRGYLGVAYGNAAQARPRCQETTEYVLANCPELDRDGDGVKNGVDLAPLEPEDRDGFEDDDGKPEPDNDRDGVLDADDRCPLASGARGNDGCPDGDRDGDGVVDRMDLAPDAPEDKDGFEDDDGKPEPDNDGDGLLDGKDACPNVAGPVEERGCPPKDDDGDGIGNREDQCRTERGEADNQGCPPENVRVIRIEKAQLALLEPIAFGPGSIKLLPGSERVLDQLAQVLLSSPNLVWVQVEAHADGAGDPAKATALTQQRAEAVKAALVNRGIAADRLTVAGVGNQRLVGPKGSPKNERIELRLLQRE